MKTKKCVLILLDGLADRSYAELGDQTPLQAADTPCLDKLARMGGCGLYHSTSPGIPMPSESAHYGVLGYPPGAFPGRGYLEALGQELSLEPQDVAMLAHLSGVESRDNVLVSVKDCPEVQETAAASLAASLPEFQHEGLQIRFHRGKGIFGVLVVRGGASVHFTDTNTMLEGQPLAALRAMSGWENDSRTMRTVRALYLYLRNAYTVLVAHPENMARSLEGRPVINALVTQRPGKYVEVASITERWGLRSVFLGSGTLYAGMARHLGMEYYAMADSGDPGEDLARRLVQAREILEERDFVFVHTKAPDKAAHTKNPEAKKAVIEALDSGLAASVAPLVADPEVLVVVTADHATPSAGPLIHSGEWVPVLFSGPNVRRDGVERFDEVVAAGGSLGCLRGQELMQMLLNCLDRARLQGIREVPDPAFYWPGAYKPFVL